PQKCLVRGFALCPSQQAPVWRDPHFLDPRRAPVLPQQAAEDDGEHCAGLDGAELPGAIGPDLIALPDRVLGPHPPSRPSLNTASFYSDRRALDILPLPP